MPELNGTILKNNLTANGGYWRLESNLTDSSGNSKDLTAIGTPTYSAGVFGNGIETSTTKAAYRNSTTDFDVTTGAVSLGAWFKTSSTSTYMQIAGKNDWNPPYYGYQLTMGNGIGGSQGKIQFRTQGASGTIDAITSTTFNDGNWHFVVATRPSGAGTNHIYVDGKMVASVTNNTQSLTNTEKFSVGNRGAVANQTSWDGMIDDVFVIPGTTLSADQIKELYEGHIYGELRPNQFGTIAGLWHLNGNSTDFSGNNNHGTDTSITYSQANGKFGQGAGFNGSSSKIICNDSVSLSITSNISFCGWFQLGALPSSGGVAMQLIDKGGSFQVLITTADKLMWVSTSTGDYAVGSQIQSLVNTAFVSGDLNKWHHLAVVVTGSTTNFYLNTLLLAVTYTYQNASTFYNSTGSLGIGSAATGGSYFNGKLDELSIHSTALTANQIRQIYAYQKGLLGRYA